MSAGMPSGRTVNLMVPVGLPNGGTARMLMTMPEADARAVVNAPDDWAADLGPMFVMIKESITEFLFQNG